MRKGVLWKSVKRKTGIMEMSKKSEIGGGRYKNRKKVKKKKDKKRSEEIREKNSICFFCFF